VADEGAQGYTLEPADSADLSLEALARIQALDAEPLAQAFRDKWLDGVTFTSEEEAIAWMQSVAGPTRPNELVFRIRLSAQESRAEMERWIGKSPGDQGTMQREWAERTLDEHRGALISDYKLAPVKPTIEYREVDSPRGYEHAFWAEPGTALADLAELMALLENKYRWDARQAIRYVLGGGEPVIPLLAVSTRSELRLGAALDRGCHASSPYLSEIILRCRPQATKKQVAEAYDEARRTLLTDALIEPGERNRATTSERTRDLAVLAFRIHRGDFTDWHDAFTTYRAQTPQDAREYVSTTSGKPRMGTFRRDTRNAYRRVTGHELIFRPGLKKSPQDSAPKGGDKA
jgi:hypothetical protein